MGESGEGRHLCVRESPVLLCYLPLVPLQSLSPVQMVTAPWCPGTSSGRAAAIVGLRSARARLPAFMPTALGWLCRPHSPSSASDTSPAQSRGKKWVSMYETCAVLNPLGHMRVFHFASEQASPVLARWREEPCSGGLGCSSPGRPCEQWDSVGGDCCVGAV